MYHQERKKATKYDTTLSYHLLLVCFLKLCHIFHCSASMPLYMYNLSFQGQILGFGNYGGT